MSETIWKNVVTILQTLKDIPSWLEPFVKMDYASIKALPPADDTTTGIITQPDVSEIMVKSDYLDFLRVQIRLKPRGPEWDKILQGRLKALEPFVGKQIMTIHLRQRPDIACLYIDPETGKLIRFEAD